jgi:hypothetical protein
MGMPQSNRLLLPSLVLLLAACGQTAPPDTSGGVDVQFSIDIHQSGDGSPSDTLVDLSQPSDVPAADASIGDSAPDVGSPGSDEVVNGTCEFPASPQDGEAGAACKVDGDCNSGICVNTVSGKVCSYTCFDCCPSGFACKPYGGSSGNLVCQAVGVDLCRPCNKDAECQKNGSGALCVNYGDAGSFCGSACSGDGDCASGYVCQDATGEKGAAKQCVLGMGECQCSAAAIAASASTTCQIQNTFGTCTSTRACGYAGLSVCTAATPAQESCGDGIDNDCNGVTDESGAYGCTTLFADSDKDGEGAAGSTGKCLCSAVDSYTATTASDCDDGSAAVNSAAKEVCDGADNDCDGKTDEGCDGDGDGFCSVDMAVVGTPTVCPQGGGDCNDGDASVHPGQIDLCGNFKDDDCDGLTDSGPNVSACVAFFQDGDGDGFGAGSPICQCGVKAGYTAVKGGDCADDVAAIHPGASETCNGKDDNCDGQTDEAGASGCTAFWTDVDGDGFGVGASVCRCAADKLFSASKGGDCDDLAVSINPAATETCNGKDDDCDGVTDEMGAQGCSTYFMDKDQDGFGDATTGICLCSANPLASTQDSSDCNDSEAAAHPGAKEVCDGIDNDCNGQTDGANSGGCTNFFEDGDGDGYGVTGKSACLCAASAAFSAAKDGDCQDSVVAINPGASEVCDGVDNNCANGIDEEDAAGCTVWARDHDGDGFGAFKDSKCLCAPSGEYTASLTTDCNDNDKAIHPKALEVCDGVDNDCDGLTDPAGADGCNNWFVDKDGDGYGTYAAPSKCLCEGSKGFASIGGDCNDGNASISPDAAEVCNGKDDNCDGSIDPVNTSGCTVFYSDSDGDGYGVGNLLQCACAADGGFSATQGGDCNDGDVATHPGATESCNGKDDNCNGQTDEGLTKAWYSDTDKDGYGSGGAIFGCTGNGLFTATKAGDCDDANATTYPGAPELCNGMDDNCNGQTDEGGSATKYFLDSDGDGFGTGGGQILCGTSGGYSALVGGDCDDSNSAVHPGAGETCNDKDDNCDGQTDEGLPTGQYYKDLDGDGYGAGLMVTACSGTGFVGLNGDCNDGDAAVHPNATEVCDNADNDCDGVIDDGFPLSLYYVDADKDGYGIGNGFSACAAFGSKTAQVAGDCNDANASVNPGAGEVCGNTVDENCNGATDEGCVIPTCSSAVLDNFEGALTGWTASPAQYWGKYGPGVYQGSSSYGYFKVNSYGTLIGYPATSGATATKTYTIPAGTTGLSVELDWNPCLSKYCTIIDKSAVVTLSLDGEDNVVDAALPEWQGPTYILATWNFAASSVNTQKVLTVKVVSASGSNNRYGYFGIDMVQTTCN